MQCHIYVLLTTIKTRVSGQFKHQVMKKPKYQLLEDSLYCWFFQKTNTGLPISVIYYMYLLFLIITLHCVLRNMYRTHFSSYTTIIEFLLYLIWMYLLNSCFCCSGSKPVPSHPGRGYPTAGYECEKFKAWGLDTDAPARATTVHTTQRRFRY